MPNSFLTLIPPVIPKSDNLQSLVACCTEPCVTNVPVSVTAIVEVTTSYVFEIPKALIKLPLISISLVDSRLTTPSLIEPCTS